MTPETKHTLILGGGLIAAVVLGIIVYKKYEANSQAGQAASDQASQDELAYIESLSLGGAYSAYGMGTGGTSLTIPSAPAGQSLADEITQLEQAFGLASTPAASTPAASSSSTSSTSVPSKPINRRVPSTDYVLAGSSSDLHQVLEESVGAEGSYVA